jgi:TRAP-type mannitol/chloroaromatic compound transport system permease small subunit
MFIKKSRGKLFLRAIQSGIDAALVTICAVFATKQMLFVLGEGTRTVGLKLPTWIIYTVILVGLFLMAMYSACHCVDYIVKFLKCGSAELQKGACEQP